MSEKNDDGVPTEPGWYLPVEDAPLGFWNPYLLTEDGDWFESTEDDGRVLLMPHELMTPLVRLVPAERATASPVSLEGDE